jgi:sortase B
MKRRAWNLAAVLARGGDRLLSAAIGLMLIVTLLLGGYGLWDTWNIYRNAGVSAELLKYKPTSTGEDAPNPTLEEMQKINKDVCAWLTVDDTNIDYPVVQGDTNAKYLNQAVDGSFSLSGSIFLDYRNANDFSDAYSLIYGHHMEGEVMFGEIPDFLETDYFQSHTTGTLFTIEHTYDIEWFACEETDAYDKMIYDPTVYTDKNSVTKLLSYLEDSATQYRDIDVSASDHLIALSTCAEATGDDRVILIGRLSRNEPKLSAR